MEMPVIWRPAQSVNGITNIVKYHHTRGTLTPENLLELDPKKDQLGMGHKQILPDSKTKVWVDEQNRMNTEKTLGYDKSHEEARDTRHPDPQISIEPPIKSQKRGTVDTSEKDTPQPAHALQEFVKHIADPLVNKGWNLHLKFGKGEFQGEQFIQGSSPREPTTKTDKKEKVSKPQIGRQIPLEMGTGGGGGKKGGNGGKRPPEDKVEIEDHPSEGEEDDSSSETSLELNLNPQQLASVGLDRPLLRLRLMPSRRRIIATAPGGGGTPPPVGGGTVTVPLPERQNGTGTNQPIEDGGGPPQPPNGVGGGTGSLLSERGRRIPQQLAGGGGAPPPGGNGNGNGNGNGEGGRPPLSRGNGANGSDDGDDGDGGGDDSPPLSDHGQP